MDPIAAIKVIPERPPPRLSGKFSPEIIDFVSVCLRKNPNERPSSMDLLLVNIF